MRIIKFRGKNVYSNNWIYGSYHKHIDITPAAIYKTIEERDKHITEHTHHYIIQDGFSDYNMPRKIEFTEINPSTLCQFTSLFDKDNKEIYEGDILRFGNSPSGVCEVKWNESIAAFCILFYFEDEICSRPLGGGVEFAIKVEVIGNIFDNPELLKGGEK